MEGVRAQSCREREREREEPRGAVRIGWWHPSACRLKWRIMTQPGWMRCDMMLPLSLACHFPLDVKLAVSHCFRTRRDFAIHRMTEFHPTHLQALVPLLVPSRLRQSGIYLGRWEGARQGKVGTEPPMSLRGSSCREQECPVLGWSCFCVPCSDPILCAGRVPGKAG